MKLKPLHITSGDEITSVLKKQGFEGSIITWREMLCEGKTLSEVGSELFWKTRFDFLHKFYKITKKYFLDSIVAEYQQLSNEKETGEIVLWFNTNLYCYINLIAILSWLHHRKKTIPVTLICNSDGKSPWDSLADLSGDQLRKCYSHRLRLSPDDIEYADYIWQLYCSDNPLRLETFSKFNSSQFQYLPDAIKAHILRFPSLKNGLNKLENDILSIAATHKSASKEKLVAQLLQTEKPYGYTQVQYYKMIDRLRPLFHSFNPVRLSKTGEEVRQGVKNYYALMRDEEIYLGGSKKYNFLYDADAGKLLKL